MKFFIPCSNEESLCLFFSSIEDIKRFHSNLGFAIDKYGVNGGGVYFCQPGILEDKQPPFVEVCERQREIKLKEFI